MALPIISCKTARNVSKLWKTKTKFWSIMVEQKLSYVSILSMENIPQTLSYEEATKEFASKNVGGRLSKKYESS